MDSYDPVRVYSVSDPIRAEIIRNALQVEGIRCSLEGDHQAGMVGVGVFAIHVLVEAADADRARKLIESHDRHAD